MGSNIKQTQVQVQKLTPQQILQANIMQLNNALLEQRIIKELEENPTLEIIDDEENISDEKIKDDSDESEFDWEELDSDSERFELSKPSSDSGTDFLVTNHVSPKTLADRIKEQLVDINISDEMMNIAHEIIGNIDDDGYFKMEPILIADRIGVAEQDVLSVLRIIQTLEPKGVACRSLQECMMLQINQEKHPLSYSIIKDCFEEFSKKAYEKICQKLSCSMDEIKVAIKQIKKTNPKPGDGLPASEKEFIIPDIIMEKRGDEWIAHMNDNSMYELQISSEYKKMLENKNLDKSAAKFIRDKTQSANWFIDAINQRKQTMLEIMGVIANKQTYIFREEKQELIPMVLKDIAQELDLDVSTISRATSGKHVQLPWGIFEIKDFFSESIKTSSGKEISNTVVKNRIKEIISSEDKSNPLDDEAINDLLIKDGYVIARRTVSKYRNMMGIPKSKLRREITDE